MNRLFLIFIFTFTYLIYPQEFSFDIFKAEINQSVLKVLDTNDTQIYQKEFLNPFAYESDLDDDGITELLIRDSISIDGKPDYMLYLYNTIDSFYLADKIISGSYEPYESASEETGGTIIISGNPDFNKFTSEEIFFLPVSCWRYEAGDIFLVNDEVYDVYVAENELIVNYIEDYYSSNIKNCNSSNEIKPAIVSAYINYINAGENSIAYQLIKKYYLCGNSEEFITEINNLLSKEN